MEIDSVLEPAFFGTSALDSFYSTGACSNLTGEPNRFLKLNREFACTEKHYCVQRSRINSLTNEIQCVSVSEDPASYLFAKMESFYNHFLGLVLHAAELLGQKSL